MCETDIFLFTDEVISVCNIMMLYGQIGTQHFANFYTAIIMTCNCRNPKKILENQILY